MSAFVCSAKHIGVLAQAMNRWKTGVMPVEKLAAQLAIVNVESFDALYAARHGKFSDLANFVQESKEEASKPQENYSSERLWGLAQCWLYQSCESEVCENSETYKLVEKYSSFLKEQCAKQGITQFTGWSL